MVAFPICVGIGLCAWFPLEWEAAASVVVVFDGDVENWISHCHPKSGTYMQKEIFPQRPGIRFYGICNTTQVNVFNL